MLNVSLADSGSCQPIYGRHWNCLSDAWKGWLTNSGRLNKLRQSDKGKTDTKTETVRPLYGQEEWGSVHLNMADISQSTLKTQEQTQAILSDYPAVGLVLIERILKLFDQSRSFIFCNNTRAFQGAFWLLLTGSLISLHRVCPSFAPSPSQLSCQASKPFVSISCHSLHLACTPIQYRSQQLLV